MSGIMVAAAIGVAGAGTSIYGASKSASAGESAAKQQKELSMADLAFRQKQYDRYLGMYGPIEEKLGAEARSEEPIGYDRMKAQIETQAGEAGRNMSASMAQRGIAGSGLDVGGMRGLAMNKMNALSGAYSQGLENKRRLGMELTGRGQIGAAAQGISGGMQNLANFYGNQADLYNRAAERGWQNAGQSLQGVGSMLAKRSSMQNTQKAEPEPESSEENPLGWDYSNLSSGNTVTPAFGKNYNLY